MANTGHHYGVTACLGCKTFFRRVVLQANSPKCKYKNQCRLEKSANAKRLCRSCRYLKCKEVGMTEEALHPGRDVIGRRHRHSEDSSPMSNSSINQSHEIESPLNFNQDDIDVLEAIQEMDIEIRQRTARLRGQSPKEKQSFNFYSPTCNYSNVAVNHSIGGSLKVDISLLREWVSRVPDFTHLTDKYQQYLLRRFCLRYTVIEHGLFTVQMPPHKNVWFLSDRTCLVSSMIDIPDEIRSLLTPAIIEEQKLLAPFTSMLIREVADPLRNLKPTSTEIAAIKVLMLLKPTCLRELNAGELAGSEDIEAVLKTRNRVISGLHSHYVQKRMGVEDIAVRLGELLMLIGGIEVCADRALEEMHMLRVFNLSSFDASCSDVIFGFNRDF
ncbi:unnamed protein product [Caenorhabditis bovis]|uniref:Nuclear receptor domain-containing protein n=1 Tax=Caenorhabditis bovis TaxID=2654633 RepID=A0A8S1F1I5_9PELO|nr:unnamed protein product [Caenorhabditis bovis]